MNGRLVQATSHIFVNRRVQYELALERKLTAAPVYPLQFVGWTEQKRQRGV